MKKKLLALITTGILMTTLTVNAAVTGADHTFKVLTEDQSYAQEAITVTADWFEEKLK